MMDKGFPGRLDALNELYSQAVIWTYYITEFCESTEMDKDKEAPNEKYSKYWELELFALIGFCASGVFFIASGIQNGDILTIVGSSVWILSCIVWMLTFKKYFINR